MNDIFGIVDEHTYHTANAIFVLQSGGTTGITNELHSRMRNECENGRLIRLRILQRHLVIGFSSVFLDTRPAGKRKPLRARERKEPHRRQRCFAFFS